MRFSILAAVVFSAATAQAQVKLGGSSVNARRLWKSGVAAVVNGNKEMARALWERCYKADPRDQDCRAGLILLGHDELIEAPDMEGYTPPQEETLREDARAVISGRVDKGSAMKNWNLGTQRFQRGDMRGAQDAWTRCLELDPKNADCRTGLERLGVAVKPAGAGAKEAGRQFDAGMKFLMSGQKAKARAAFTACLAADAGHKDCAKGLQRSK